MKVPAWRWSSAGLWPLLLLPAGCALPGPGGTPSTPEPAVSRSAAPEQEAEDQSKGKDKTTEELPLPHPEPSLFAGMKELTPEAVAELVLSRNPGVAQMN